MSLPIKIFLILAALLALQSFISLRNGYGFARYVRSSRRQPPGNYLPPAAVIIPLKGVGTGCELNLSSFLAQDYPRYQVVFVVASEKDPAYNLIALRLNNACTPKSRGASKISLVIAGHSDVRGEKVNNLLHGLEAVDAEAEVLVFADADARPTEDWLRSLVAPLADSSVTVSTGFRWYLPGESFVSQLRAAWDTSIATLLGDHEHNFAWGGSMALRAADFRRLEVAERYWAGTVSDDYAVTRAVRQRRGKIRFEPRCLLASHEESTFREFLRWSNRQIIITRVYAAHFWGLGLAAHGFYCGTFLFGLLLLGLPVCSGREKMGIAAMLATIVWLGIAKGCLRATVAREIFPEESAALALYGARYWQLAPLIPWVMLFNFTVAGFARRIEWGGTHYHLKSASEVRVLRRD